MNRKKLIIEGRRAVFLLGIIALVAVFFLGLYMVSLPEEKAVATRGAPDSSVPKTPCASVREVPPTPVHETPCPEAPEAPVLKTVTRTTNRMAIVIDDIGYNLTIVDRLIDMERPITFSVLPRCPYSKEAAERAWRAGLEVILHLPLEPHGYPHINPGEGTLFVAMTNEEIVDRLRDDIACVPHIDGVNNHMGSRFMENREKLSVVFTELKKRDLFFLDCYTTRRSQGRKSARETGLAFTSRDVFIDNGQSCEDTYRIIADLVLKRDRWKTLICVGHPYNSTVDALKTVLPLLEEHHVKIVPLSQLVNTGKDHGE